MIVYPNNQIEIHTVTQNDNEKEMLQTLSHHLRNASIQACQNIYSLQKLQELEQKYDEKEGSSY